MKTGWKVPESFELAPKTRDVEFLNESSDQVTDEALLEYRKDLRVTGNRLHIFSTYRLDLTNGSVDRVTFPVLPRTSTLEFLGILIH